MRMASERSIRRYRRWYGWLIRVHSARHRERFAQGMEQTFHDVCRERARAGTGVLTFVVGAFAETSVGIARDNMTHMTQRQRNILLIAAATASILLVPLVAMQFRDDVV